MAPMQDYRDKFEIQFTYLDNLYICEFHDLSDRKRAHE